MKREKNIHHGSSLDSFLEEEGVYESFQTHAIKETIAWQLAQEMEKKNMSKSKMASLMGTSRSQLDRLLDPEQDVTLSTLARAANMIGCKLKVELV